MKKYLLLALILVIGIYFYDNRIYVPPHQTICHKNIISKNVLKHFDYNNFTQKGLYGNIIADVFEYKNKEITVSNKYKTNIYKFLNNNKFNNKKQQILLHLNEYPIFDNVLKLIKQDLSKIYKLNNNIKYKLRISKTPWNWGAHFDCGNGILVQLYNNRIVGTLNYNIKNDCNLYGLSINELEKKYKNLNKTILKPGDLIEFPIQLIHSVDGYSNNKHNISIALTFFIDNDYNENKECMRYFDKYFKKRTIELYNGLI